MRCSDGQIGGARYARHLTIHNIHIGLSVLLKVRSVTDVCTSKGCVRLHLRVAVIFITLANLDSHTKF